MKKILIYFLYLITLFCLVLYLSTCFISETWKYNHFSQILFHFSVDLNTSYLSEESKTRLFKYIFLFLELAVLLFIFSYAAANKTQIQTILTRIYLLSKKLLKKIDKPITLFTTIIFLSVIIMVFGIDNRLHLFDYFSQQPSSFFSEQYFKLDTSKAQTKNKNLIVIFLESVEDGYSNSKIYGKNLIQELEQLKKEGISFPEYKKIPGASFTLDGICAQTLGVPIVWFPIEYHDDKYNYSAILKDSPSIFNLLQNLSYETIAFSGASKDYTSKGKFFKVHGFDSFWGKEYWQQKGWKLDGKNKGSHWGYNDEFLYDRLKDYLKKKKYNERFAVFFETVDTHFPNGYALQKEKHFNDIRDSFMRLSKLTANFIHWAKKQPWYKDTVIVIVGDHPWQMPQDSRIFTEIAKQSQNHQLYNVILNSTQKPIRQITGWSSLDMAPTILHAMGVHFSSQNLHSNKISKNRIGLGVSLFSNEKTLVEKHGQSFMQSELYKPNRFYQSLF